MDLRDFSSCFINNLQLFVYFFTLKIVYLTHYSLLNLINLKRVCDWSLSPCEEPGGSCPRLTGPITEERLYCALECPCWSHCCAEGQTEAISFCSYRNICKHKVTFLLWWRNLKTSASMRSWRATHSTARARSREPFLLIQVRSTEKNFIRTVLPADPRPNPASSACRASRRCSARLSSGSTRCFLWGPSSCRPPPSCSLHGRSWLSSIRGRWRGFPPPRRPPWSRGSEGEPGQLDLESTEVWRKFGTASI